MAVGKTTRLSKLAREFNVGISTIVEFLHKKGFSVDPNPNTKISEVEVNMLEKEYKSDINLKKESELIQLKSHRPKSETSEGDAPEGSAIVEEKATVESKIIEKTKPIVIPTEKTAVVEKQAKPEEIKVERKEKLKILGKIDLNPPKPKKKVEKPEPQKEAVKPVEEKVEKVEPVEKTPVPEKPVEKVEKPKEVIKKETVEPIEKKVSEKPVEPEQKPVAEVQNEHIKTDIPKVDDVKVIGKIDLNTINQKTRPAKKSKEEREKDRKERQKVKHKSRQGRASDSQKSATDDGVIKAKVSKLNGPVVVGKIDVNKDNSKKPATDNASSVHKRKRKRIQKPDTRVNLDAKQQAERKRKDAVKKVGRKRLVKKEISEEDVQKQIKDTLARLTTKGKSKGSKHRRDKRAAVNERMQAEVEKQSQEQRVLKVTEFVSAAEFATMMDVPVTNVISTCMSLGLFVSINQRLDAETMSIVAEEFGFTVDFVSVDIQEAIEEDLDKEEDLGFRPPIVTVMGHVDHGKTSLLDYIRDTNVIAGEAGGITQHIGAYHVSLPDGRDITFLDTPGHEAFTAMRARGAQVTDIAIIIVAADDNIMPQTVEAINHAQAAGVPIVFAINKIDKNGADPEKIKEGLANMNFLVEAWGGKYQSQDISAKAGTNINELLEKVLLEAEMLDLKANANKNATGTIIESTLDKGRGYVATILVQNGTLKQGDIVLAGQNFGHVKAMFNERNQRIQEAGPAQPVIILGLSGAPQAGDKFNVMDTEREARLIANKREQLAREQGLRTQKHITLDEIGRRIAIGNFQELNLIVKGDVDGSIEALSDSLIKLSTEEIQVNVIHKSVGAISESDIMLATASEAIVVGFQVRPTINARKIAEKEQIDIRLYSIIYDAINEIKAAMEGMLSPEIKEEITGTAEILEVFKITKVGTIAGCIVRDGRITRSSKVRVIRDGIVIYTGNLGSLKRFKDDVKEVKNGYECGLNVDNFNNITVGDHIESFREVEVAKTL